MGESEKQPFVGSKALADEVLSRYELRRYYKAIMPDVYLAKHHTPSLRQRIYAAWLWSRRQAVISGLAASALHGAKWVDDTADVELIWRNARAPQGVRTRHELLLDGETQPLGELTLTTPERTAFDLGRRGTLEVAVANLDALAQATGFKAIAVAELAQQHRHTKGLRQLEAALDLMDHGAQSPKETWLRLLLISAGFPRPQTQIPLFTPNGYPKYFLDMGYQHIKLAVEYDGEQHRTSRPQYKKDVERLEYIGRLGWTHIRVLAGDTDGAVVHRVRCAWNRLTLR